MFARRIVLALLAVLLPVHAQAQLDDLLAPLTPQQEKKAAEPKAKKRRSAKKPPPKKKAPTPELELAPLVEEEKTELLVKVVGPDDAEVLLDDERIRAGKAFEVDPGEYTLTVRRPGYAEVKKNIRVKDTGTTKVSAVLDAVAGVLAVSADVPGAKVFVDGQAVADAPVKGLLLEPGMHDIVIRREGFEDHASRIAVRAGRDYTIAGKLRPLDGNTRTLLAENGDRPERTNLAPQPSSMDDGSISFEQPPEVESEPLYKKWYVWAGAGAVVVAAVTSAVLVSQNQNASGTLRPEDVCGGPCDGVINAPGIVSF